MATEVILPKLGQTMEEGAIVDWLVEEGDQVKRGDLLFTVDKSDRFKIDRVRRRVDFSVIGEMVERRRGVKLIGESGIKRDLSPAGFKHF